MQKRIYFCKKIYLKDLVTGFLFVCTCLTSFGQSVDFTDTVFAKRLNSLNLNLELPYRDMIGDKIQELTHQKIQFAAKSLGIFFAERTYIDSAIRAAELPDELQYLPLSLSQIQMNTCAGFWQLPYIAAIRYGLEITGGIDDRLDIKKSTSAAIAYLRKLSEKYDNVWDVIIAYANSVPALEAAKIRTNHTKDIWVLYERGNLPNAAVIPNFITYTYLANFYQSHHIKPIAPEKNEGNAPIIYPKPAAAAVQTAPMLSNHAPKTANLSKKENKKKITYTIKNGDTLSKIAQKYGVSVVNIQKWNNLKNDRISIGQKLIIYP